MMAASANQRKQTKITDCSSGHFTHIEVKFNVLMAEMSSKRFMGAIRSCEMPRHAVGEFKCAFLQEIQDLQLLKYTFLNVLFFHILLTCCKL